MKPILDRLCNELKQNLHDHVVFWLGSIISTRGPTACANVWQIRDELVVCPLLRRVETFDGLLRDDLTQLLRRLVSPWNDPRGEAAARNDKLTAAAERIPFERFMSCLAAAEDHGVTATELVRIACRATAPQIPGVLHRLVVGTAHCLLDRRLCKRVTLVTTNYDCLLEAASGRKMDDPSSMAWRPLKGFPSSLPSLEHTGYSPGQLTLLKVHGTINKPETLVFTADGLAVGMLNESHFQKLREWVDDTTLFLFAGYGFNDPDLRPMLSELLRSTTSTISVGTRPREAVWITNSSDSEEQPERGMDVLRREFLLSTRVTPYPCDLFDSERPNEHFLLGMAGRLGLRTDGLGDSLREAPRFDAAGAADQASDTISRLSEESTIEFVARLCDASNNGDAHQVLNRLVLHSDDDARRPERVTHLVRSHAHRSNYGAYVSTCREIRNRWTDPETSALTLGFESFAFTVGVRDPLRACQLLRRGRRYIKRTRDPIARARFEHYDGHFSAKMLQYLDLTVRSAILDSEALPFSRRFARWIAMRLNKAAQAAEVAKDVQFVAEIRDLEAQTLIYSGDPGKALDLAERSQRYYSAMGLINAMALADRTLGWIHLARGNRLSAIRALGRGLFRSLYSVDTTLQPKLAANLVRVLIATEHIDPAEAAAQNLRPDALAESSRRLSTVPGLDRVEHGDGIQTCRYLRECYPGNQYARLLAHIGRFLAVERFPVYHPPGPEALN